MAPRGLPRGAPPADRAVKEHRPARPSANDEERRAGLAAGDEEVLARCRASAKFRGLYDDGDLSAHGGDHSAADLALLNLLVLSGATDPVRLDRLFRSSALVRPKWTGRPDYRQRTIEAALGAGVRSGDGDPIEVLRRRLAAAERALETERRLRRQHSELLAQTARLFRNRTLKNERNVALALAHRFASFESRHEVPPFAITVAEIAEAAGINRNTAGRHVAKLEAAGLVTRETRLVPGFVDPATGEIVPPKTPTFMAPIGDSVGFLTAVAALDGRSAWGGKRARTQDGAIASAEQVPSEHDPGDDGTTVGGGGGPLKSLHYPPHPPPWT